LKPLALLLLLLPLGAHAAAPEILCDPDAKVTFQSRWIRASSVRLSADVNWELPWTGKEPLTSGLELRGKTSPDAPEEIATLPETASFVTYRAARSDASPLGTTLYVERELLTGSEQDGLVIAELTLSGNIEATAPSSRFRVYHCRSR
jgi:hypothetical protein